MSGLSIARGTTDVPLLETTIGQALLKVVDLPHSVEWCNHEVNPCRG